MKSAFLFIILCTVAAYCQQPMTLEEVTKMAYAQGQTCIKETGVDVELLKKEFAGENVDDKNVKCFLSCFMIGMESMTAEGVVQIEAYKARFQPGPQREELLVLVDKCKDEKGAGPCETAYAFQTCAAALKKRILNFVLNGSG